MTITKKQSGFTPFEVRARGAADTSGVLLQTGFTLIEIVVYLALFAILFGGAVAAAFNVIESNGRNQTKAMLQEEGNFLIAKINWAVSNAENVQVPGGGHLQATVLGDHLEFWQEGDYLVLKRNSGDEVELNNSSIQLFNLSFIDISATGDGEKGINYGFDLKSKAANGVVLVSNFNSTTYLRK
jgi:prepilin-type N-terminal cleavage/methylation domain-containing protein